VANPANMRVTRQRAARERQQAQQQQQLQSEQPSGGEPMAVEPAPFNLDPLTIRDPQLCHHYTKDIYSYLGALELEHRVSPHFMQASRAPRCEAGPGQPWPSGWPRPVRQCWRASHQTRTG
jgi:hypothetical protein